MRENMLESVDQLVR